MNGGEIPRVGNAEPVGHGDQQTANGRKGLCVAQHLFPLLRIGKQLRQPSHGCDEFHTDTHKHEAAEEQQHLGARRIPGRKRRKGIEEDAPCQHTATTQPVRQISSEKAKHPTRQRRDVEQLAHPGAELRRSGRRPDQLLKSRPHDQGEHQQFVNIKSKTDRSNEADQPLGTGEFGGVGHGMLVVGGCWRWLTVDDDC